uniref:Uncharacterized protein n=1 Tax=Eutreptiella gymnastica TaxID=73025 RepID=A0A7S4CF97_9EUGL
MAYSDSNAALLQSPGHSDEKVIVYYYRNAVSPEQLAEFRDKTDQEEGDIIDLRLVPLKDVWRRTADGKTLAALMLFQMLQAQNKLPQCTVARGTGSPT